MVLLWKAVFSCMRRGKKITALVGKLAERVSIPSEEYRTITHKEARAKLAVARKAKRQVHKEASKERAQWLEDIAKANAQGQPNKQWEQVMKRMVNAARQKSIQQKLTSFMKPQISKLDYIEVPQHEW